MNRTIANVALIASQPPWNRRTQKNVSSCPALSAHQQPFALTSEIHSFDFSYDKNLLQFSNIFTLSVCDYKVWEVFKDPAIYQGLINDPQQFTGCGNNRLAAAAGPLNSFIMLPQIRTIPFG